MEPQETDFLAFVDLVGKRFDGKYIYRFDFTKSTDIVWGDQWNATPAGIVPNIEPLDNCISLSGQVLCSHRYMLAKENTCFSMQDCIDGIIPLLFDQPYDDELMVLPFGMPMSEVEEVLAQHGLQLENLKDVNEEKDNEVIDDLIDKLEGQFGTGEDNDIDGEDEE